ncbi:unnamed protein product [Camellia sinensis]
MYGAHHIESLFPNSHLLLLLLTGFWRWLMYWFRIAESKTTLESFLAMAATTTTTILLLTGIGIVGSAISLKLKRKELCKEKMGRAWKEKFQLEDAIEMEDFQEAAKLKMAIVEATSKDSVAEIMSQNAVEEERYQDDLQLCRCTGSGLVGWWVGCSNDSDDPFGKLIHITPGVGRFLGRSHCPSVVFLQQAKSLTNSTSSLSNSKPTQGPITSETEDASIVDINRNEVKAEKSEGKSINVEGATEEGITNVINFLKDKIPELKLKVMKINVIEEVIEDSDALKQLMQEDSENTPGKGSNDETNNLIDGVIEDGKNLDMKVFIGGILRNIEDTSTKDECVRLPAEIKDIERDSFALHVPARGQDRDTDESVSIDVREIVKLAVSQAQKRGRLSECTSFSQITSSEGDLDPFIVGLHVGAFGSYGTEVVQLRCKYGNWNCEDDTDKTSNVEFFEYVEAVKLTGDLNVPAGQVTFRAKIGRGNCIANRGLYPDELGVEAVYEELGKYGDLENQVLYRELVEELEPSIRYCLHKLGESNLQTSELMHIGEMEGPALDIFKAKLEAVMAEARSQQAASMTEFHWLGHKFPISNAKTRVSILKDHSEKELKEKANKLLSKREEAVVVENEFDARTKDVENVKLALESLLYEEGHMEALQKDRAAELELVQKLMDEIRILLVGKGNAEAALSLVGYDQELKWGGGDLLRQLHALAEVESKLSIHQKRLSEIEAESAGGGRNVSAHKENGVSNSMERDLLPFQSMGPHMFLMAVPVPVCKRIPDS